MQKQHNVLGKRTRKSTQVAFNLRFVWPPTWVNLRGFETTWVDLRAQIRKQVDPRFHRLATQRKSTQVDRKYMREFYDLLRLP